MVTAETLRYMFSIKAGFPARWVAKTPAGYRIDVEFHTEPSDYPITVATEPYWLTWGEDVRSWLQNQPQVLSAWREHLEEEEKKKNNNNKGEEKEKETPLTLVAKLTETSSSAGSGRQRLQAEAQSPELGAVLDDLRAFVRENDLDCPAWLGLKGRIVSGVDWALLRADGVVEFDGQWVFTDGDLADKKAVLVNARTSGSMDLCEKEGDRPLTLDHAVAKVRAIEGHESVRIALALKFEAPQEPEPWASKRYTRRKGQLRYVRLSRAQFVAIGSLMAFGNSGAKVDLSVYQVKV